MPLKFTPINHPHMRGIEATSESGITLEVVQCYEGQWSLFLTRNGSVVARCIEEYRNHGNGYESKAQALKYARTLENI